MIQARMGSTRLPGEVLLELAGGPMLVRVVERGVVMATAAGRAGEPVVRLCQDRQGPFFRGDEEDALDRYYGTACLHKRGGNRAHHLGLFYPNRLKDALGNLPVLSHGRFG